MELRPNGRVDFPRKIESKILPPLHKPKRIQNETTFVHPAGNGAFVVSLWDTKGGAEEYNRIAFAQVTSFLHKLVEGTPRVTAHEDASSTFGKIDATQEAAQ